MFFYRVCRRQVTNARPWFLHSSRRHLLMRVDTVLGCSDSFRLLSFETRRSSLPLSSSLNDTWGAVLPLKSSIFVNDKGTSAGGNQRGSREEHTCCFFSHLLLHLYLLFQRVLRADMMHFLCPTIRFFKWLLPPSLRVTQHISTRESRINGTEVIYFVFQKGKLEGEKMLITFPNKICNMLAGCQPRFRCLSLVMDNDNRHHSTATRCRIHRHRTGDRKLNIPAKSYLAWSFFSSFSLTAEGGSSHRPSWRFGSDIFSLLGLQWNYSGYASSLQNAFQYKFGCFKFGCISPLYSNSTCGSVRNTALGSTWKTIPIK